MIDIIVKSMQGYESFDEWYYYNTHIVGLAIGYGIDDNQLIYIWNNAE